MPDRHQLEPYAVRAQDSRGRRHCEAEHPYRNCFQRDRDRIIHSRAFRRLEYKTQVFPNHEGDHFRTRLTHTIEVAQLARTVAGVLGINGALAEAIALTHDIGHPPFGHVGEEALDRLMADSGGFEHNRHTLRTVDELEEKYAGFRGLNLTYEVREGIVKHDSRYERFTEVELAGFAPQERPPLEAQIIDLVDHIAYNVHDVDDGVEAHVLSVAELADEVPVFGRAYHRLRVELPAASERELFNETLRRLIDRLVTDLIRTTRERIDASGVDSVAAVRSLPEHLARQSDRAALEIGQLQGFLFERLYRSARVHAQMKHARDLLAELFEAYRGNPGLLPARHQRRAQEFGVDTAIADYVAGMTDRFVVREHTRLIAGEGIAEVSTIYGLG